MIRNLVFDFGRVLLDYDIPALISQFFENEQQIKEFASICLTPAAMELQDRGDKPWDELLDDMKKACPKYSAQVDMYDRRYQEFMTGEMPGMRDLLLELKARGYKLYGLTNWSVKVYETMANYPEIFALLDGKLISCEEHMVKPYPEVYERLCEKFSLKAEECFFTDDKAENIEGARKVGIEGVVFENAQQYRRALEERGIL